MEISHEGRVIRVILPGLPDTLAERVRSLSGVTNVEKYLRVTSPDYPHLFVGVAPGSELRVGEALVSPLAGEGFESGDDRGAIPGIRVNSNRYLSGGGMAAMAHRFTAGQSFEVNGIRLRVVDLFRSPDTDSENAILVPLATAQEMFAMPGQLTDIFVSVNSEDNVETVVAEIENILGVK